MARLHRRKKGRTSTCAGANMRPSLLQDYTELQPLVACPAGLLVEQLVMHSSQMTPRIHSIVLGCDKMS